MNAYIGNRQTTIGKYFFSNKVISHISDVVSISLKDIHPSGVIVPKHRIESVMDAVFTNFTPSRLGDIHSRYYLWPECRNYVDMMVEEVISIIVSDVRYNLTKEKNATTLNSWIVTQGNLWGLQRHSNIKLNNKHPTSGFNFNF